MATQEISLDNTIKPPIELDSLQPKIVRFNELLAEKKPLNIYEEYNLMCEIDFTMEELRWLGLSQGQRLRTVIHSITHIINNS